MRDFGAAHHTTKDLAQPRIDKHLLCENGEGVMYIVLWCGSRDAVQVSRSHAQKALNLIRWTIFCVCILEELDDELIVLRQSPALENRFRMPNTMIASVSLCSNLFMNSRYGFVSIDLE
jgi:hypothetical protein